MNDIDWNAIIKEAITNAHMGSDAALITVGLWPEEIDEITKYAIHGGIRFGAYGMLRVLNRMGIINVPFEDQVEDEQPEGYN